MSQKTTREKVDTWLHRAGGTLSNLCLWMVDFDTLFDVLGGASAAVWSSLSHLKIEIKRGHSRALLSPTVCKELRLRVLNLFSVGCSPEFWDTLWTIDVSQIDISFYSGGVSIYGRRFSGLVALQLIEVEESDVFAVLEHRSMIVILGLVSAVRHKPEPSYASTRRIELVNLMRLELSNCDCVESYFQYLIFPNLKTLPLFGCKFRRSEALLFNTLSQLEHLTLKNLVVDVPPLIGLLRNSRALRRLEYSSKGDMVGYETKAVFEALASPIPGEETLCCPQLQFVCLVNFPVLKTELVMRLVKARQPSSAICAERDRGFVASEHKAQPRRITYLKLVKCPYVDRGSFPWFKANVPSLSCD